MSCADELSPQEIADRRPRWEVFDAARQHVSDVAEQWGRILDLDQVAIARLGHAGLKGVRRHVLRLDRRPPLPIVALKAAAG